MTDKALAIISGFFLAIIFFLMAFFIYKYRKIGRRYSTLIIKLTKKSARNYAIKYIIIGVIFLIFAIFLIIKK